MGSHRRLDEAGRTYVLLCLSMESYDPGYVDAYFGDPGLKEGFKPWPLDEMDRRSKDLLQDLLALDSLEYEDEGRKDFLVEQTQALHDFTLILKGRRMNFDEECRALFGITPPGYNDRSINSMRNKLDELLPGSGTLSKRYRRYMESFRVSPDRALEAVNQLLTLAKDLSSDWLPLPNDDFHVQLVPSAPWEAYNYYQGEARSRIDINAGVPIGVDRMILYAAHEAYPGHHSMWAIREQHLLKEKGWQEHCLVALRSPLALLAEGAAQYGVELVFPADSRIRIYEESLFPSLGLPPSEAERYERISSIGSDLMFRHWVNVTRDFLDGDVDECSTMVRMQEEQLLPEATAVSYLEMMKAYRSYVVNYSAGFDLIKAFVEKSQERWEPFRQVLMEPMTVRRLKESSGLFQ